MADDDPSTADDTPWIMLRPKERAAREVRHDDERMKSRMYRANLRGDINLQPQAERRKSRGKTRA